MLTPDENFMESYFSLRSLSKNTMTLYRQAAESMEKYTNTPIQNLDETTLKKWLIQAQRELGPATIEKYAQIMRILYTHHLQDTGLTKRKAKAEAAELFDLVPFTDLRQRSKKETSLRDQVVTADEFQTLINAVNHPRVKALIAITYESGCRKGEILSLRLKDIQASQDHWSITVEGKTGTRVVPLIKSIPYLRAWLQSHPARGNENSPVFVSSFKGKVRGINEHSFNNILRLLCKKTGLRMIHPHMLRHTRLTNLAEDGLGEFQMKSFAGWTADSKMAARYIHLSGRGHMNAVLEQEGVDTGNGVVSHKPESLLEITNCPNCDSPVGSGMVHCPRCGYILDDRLRIERGDELESMRAELAELKALVMQRIADEP